jgi:muconate cycloisomerase
MNVTQLAVYHVRIPLRKPIRHASHVRAESDNLVIACRLDDKADGTVGYGEGVPRDYVTGETIDSALGLLRRSDLAAIHDVFKAQSFAEAIRRVEAVRLADVQDDSRGCRGNATRCALELALLDALGRRFGKPLSEVTCELAPELFEPKHRVRYSTAITSAKGLKATLAGWMMRLYRFRQCKVKVGIEGQDDVDRLRRIREAVGRKMDLRIDANEAWSPAEAAERIRELEPFGITSVEQPVAHEHVGCLTAVRQQVKTPIMHDESLCSIKDARDAVEQGTCDLFNLRLSKCGGFIPSLRLAQFAREHGLGYQLGCQVGETAILSAAGRHFATSVAGIRYLEGSYDRRLVREALATRDITFGYGGWAPALTTPGLGGLGGLGVAIDEAALRRVTIRKEVLLG